MIQKANLYSGSCASLTFIQTDTLQILNDSILNLVFNLSSPTTLYLQTKSSGGSSNFILSSDPFVNILGNSGFCPGKYITLQAEAVNTGTSSVTYTWNPGALTTQSISVSPSNTTTPTIYTLTTSAGITQYYTVTPIPVSLCGCNNNNLVMNGDFESHSNCPDNLSQANYAYPWAQYACNSATIGNTYGSSDYYHSCSPTCSTTYSDVCVPKNTFSSGLNNHTSGNGTGGYMGEYITEPSFGQYREYIYQQLRCPLIAGQSYNISLYTANSSYSGLASNNIGLALSQNFSTNNASVLTTYTPQLNSSSIINTTGWTQLATTYTGNNEQYLIVGNFYDDSHTTYTTSSNSSPYGPLAYYFVDDISIVPATPTLSASSATVNCGATSTLTLTASGAANAYTSWSDGIITYTGNSVYIPSIKGTTTFTCTVNLPCTGCSPITQTLTVYVSNTPTLTISSTSTAICIGSSATFTASGASTYTWAPATGLSCTTCSITNASPSISTNYTLTGVSLAGCVSTKSISITVNPLPSLTITPSNPTICYSASETLTATGAAAYVWSSTVGLSCSSCSVTVASPTATTNYTLTGTSAAGCVSTKTLAVTVQGNSCTGTQPSSYTIASTATLSGSPLFIAQNLYINSGNYTISSADVRMAPGVSIYVANGATLTIAGSWLHACASCSGSMWQGITVQNGGTLNMITSGSGIHLNDNIVEDAVQAVYTAASSSSTPIPVFNIYNTIFNRNTTGIYIDQHAGNLSANKVLNCAFTCRKLNSHSLGTFLWSGTYGDIDAATPLVPSTTNPTTLTLAGSRSRYGINIEGTNPVYPITVGDNSSSHSADLFDNLDYGIYCYAGSLTAKNNIFQNLTGNSTQMIGMGIYAIGNSSCYWVPCTGYNRLTAGNASTTADNTESNTFTDCLIGVYTDAMRHVFVNNNSFNNETTATTFTTSGSYVTGAYGAAHLDYAYYYTDREEMQFANNSVSNNAYGFALFFNPLTNTVSATSALITTNTITATGSNYCSVGVYLAQGSSKGAGSGVPQDAISVTSNSITNVDYNAVDVNAVNTSTATTGFITISQNTELSVKYSGAATTTVSPHRAAVYVTGSYNTKIDDNAKIQCTGLTSYTNTNAQYIAGVYVATSPGTTVNCNTVNYMGEDFVWEGASPGSQWKKNNMRHSRYGLVLRNSGVMGNQGASGSPSGNVWGKYVSTDITDAHTLVDHSDPSSAGSTSKLYCLAAACTGATTPLPCQNVQVGSLTTYTTGGTYQSLYTTTGTPCACIGDCGSGRMAYNNSFYADSVAAAARDSALMEIIYGIENGDPFPAYDQETRWALAYYVASQNSTLRAAIGFENAKAFAQMDGALAGKDYSHAQSILSSIIPSGTFENNWQLIGNISIKLQSDTLDSTDISRLKSIALQCPLTGGNVVYTARAMLQNQSGIAVKYIDDCTDNNPANKLAAIRKATAVEKTGEVNVYPNPNNGSMSFTYKIKEDAVLEITDVRGIVVMSHILSAINTKLDVQNNNLVNGVYLYRVINSLGIIKTGRIVIMK